jgi:hypothetical protein
MRATRKLAQELRQAVDCLPERTREAMLDGIDSNPIIVGAYTDQRGGVCPMLAAHRHGGRTNLASFAKAWDRYTGARRRPRPATEREVRTLRAMLEASLFYETSSLSAAVADHRRTADGRRQKADTGERSRITELKHKPGWAWLRVFRRYDDFQAAVDLAVSRADEADLGDEAGRRRTQEETHSLS